MNRRLLIVLAVVLIVAGLALTNALFIVDQTEQALVLQFGQPRRVINTPGLWVKRPFLEDVRRYDNRLLDFEPPPAVRARLSAMVNGSLRRVLGNVTLSSVLSHDRPVIMKQIRDEVSEQGKSFGIDVVDVRIRRADLPEENSQAIYARMVSERQQQAAQYRGEGAEAAQTVRANADRERIVILAESQRSAQRVRGDGDAESIRLYADAFGQDKEFFAFYRSMQAYRDALNGRSTSFVLTPDSGFFRFFEKPGGGAGKEAPPGVKAGSP